jgi:hypothetical protein
VSEYSWAPPTLAISNAVIAAMIDWYKVLKTLPLEEKEVLGRWRKRRGKKGGEKNVSGKSSSSPSPASPFLL